MPRLATVIFLFAATLVAAEPAPSENPLPMRFSSYDNLEKWSKDCFGGGWSTKFTTRWNGKNVELCYTIRTFTSGVATMEVTFWRPDGQGDWIRTVGTSVMSAEFKVDPTLGGVTLSAYDGSTKSWINWMTVSTPMLCNGIPQ